MKKTLYFICYVIGLLLGVLLLVFNYEAMNRDQTVLRYTMMATGIIFIIPGVIQLISSLVPKRDEFGNILPRKWYATVVAILALLWGIYILIFPLGYNDTLSISLGVSLILAGLAQTVWIVKTSESTVLRFIVPLVTIGLGVVIIAFLNKYDNGKSAQIAAIVSGIMMIIWGVNGFFSLRSKRVVAAADKAARIERKAEKEERKTAKAEAKEEAKEAKETKEISKVDAKDTKEVSKELPKDADETPDVTPQPKIENEDARPEVADSKENS